MDVAEVLALFPAIVDAGTAEPVEVASSTCRVFLVLEAGGEPGPAMPKNPNQLCNTFLPLSSDCILNASNSGFWSTGMTEGLNAAVDRTLDEGGDQFERV